MIRGNKLYINITNHCDVCCPFCCMKSDSKKQSFMNFDTIHKIMKDMDVPYIVQLEGGEPTTHPQFYLFMEYISTLEKVEEVVIDTNAFMLDRHIDKIVEIAVRNKKRITVKLSYNTYLRMIKEYMDFIEYMNNDEDEEEKIVYDTILMIGDASGKEGQFSDSDKKTAENFGCEYMDVDDFVDKYKG